MALFYNVRRFNALHQFCKDNGCGYLITDGKKITIYDLKNRHIDKELVELFDEILSEANVILWEDIKRIKEKKGFHNIDIAAYVLQNKLHYSLKTFAIKRR